MNRLLSQPLLNLLTTFALSMGAASASANPGSPSVAAGSASFVTPDAATLEVYNSPGTIINWRDFSIGVNELTRFIQQSASSTVLNRVTGGNLSQILGQLQSNGQVFLVNPAGILVGPDAVIDAAGFVASTLNLSDHDYLAGNFRFAGMDAAGSILNQGLIRAGSNGDILLIAPDIRNEGSLVSDGGRITLAAGQAMLLTDLETPEIQFELQAADDEIVNVGGITSAGGAIDLFAGTIRQDGLLSASSASLDEAGNIRLQATADTLVGGSIEATGAGSTGGSIQILGDRVGLLDGALVDASGTTGGGDINIGGSLQGEGPLPNASAVAVLPAAIVRANALERGDGGTIVLYGEELGRYYGTLEARGGALGGSGGFIETSGGQQFEIAGAPDVSAASGDGGTWLIDPQDIFIVSGASSGTRQTNPTTTPPDAIFDWDLESPFAVVGVGDLNAALTEGATVQIVTNNDGGTGAGNITLLSGVTLDIDNNVGTTSTLQLLAFGDIILDGTIAGTVGGNNMNLQLRAGGNDIALNGDVFLGDGSFSTLFGAGTQRVFHNGSGSHTVFANGFNVGTLDIGAGSLTLTSNDPSKTFGSVSNLSLTGGSLDLHYALSVGGDLSWTGGGITNSDAGDSGKLTLGQFSGFHSINATGTVTLDHVALLVAGDDLYWQAGDLLLTNNASVTVTDAASDGFDIGRLFISGASRTLGSDGSGSLLIANGGSEAGGDDSLLSLALNSGATLTLRDLESFAIDDRFDWEVGNIALDTTLLVNRSTGTVNITGDEVEGSQNLTLTLSGQDVATESFDNQSGGTVNINTAMDLNNVAFQNFSGGTVNIQPLDPDISGAGDFTLTDAAINNGGLWQSESKGHYDVVDGGGTNAFTNQAEGAGGTLKIGYQVLGASPFFESASSRIGVAFNNPDGGTVELQSGATLALDSGGTGGGAFNINDALADGTIVIENTGYLFNGSSFNLSAAGNSTRTGGNLIVRDADFDFDHASITGIGNSNTAAGTPNGTLTLDNGTFDLNGAEFSGHSTGGLITVRDATLTNSDASNPDSFNINTRLENVVLGQDSGDQIQFNLALTIPELVTEGPSPTNTITSNGTVTVSTSLTMEDVTVLNINGGSFDVGGGLLPPAGGGGGGIVIGVKGSGSNATISSGATVNINDGIYNHATGVGFSGGETTLSGTLNLLGGTLAGIGGTENLIVDDSGILNINGGALDLKGYVENYGVVNFLGAGTSHNILYWANADRSDSSSAAFGVTNFSTSGTTTLNMASFYDNAGLTTFGSDVRIVIGGDCSLCFSTKAGYEQYVWDDTTPSTVFDGGVLTLVDGTINQSTSPTDIAAVFEIFSGSVTGSNITIDAGFNSANTNSYIKIPTLSRASGETLLLSSDLVEISTLDLAAGSTAILNSGAGLTLSAGTLAGDLTVNSTGGTVDLFSGGAQTYSGNIAITSAGDVVLGDASFNSDASIASSAGSLTAGNIDAGSNDATLSGQTGLTVGNVIATNIRLDSATGNVSTGTLDASAGAGTIAVSGGDVTIGTLQQGAGGASLDARGTLTLTNVAQTTGTLALSGDASISNLNLSGGTLDLNGSDLNVGGSFTFSGGTLDTSGGSLTAPGPLLVSGGTVKGSGGTINGGLTMNGGTLAPGSSPGAMTIVGNLNLGGASTTLFELGGYSAGSTMDFINVTGNLAITPGATAQVALFNGFVPVTTAPFNVMQIGGTSSGAFSVVSTQQFTAAVAGNTLSLTPGFITPGTTRPTTPIDVLVLTDNEGGTELIDQGAQESPDPDPDDTLLAGDDSLQQRLLLCE